MIKHLKSVAVFLALALGAYLLWVWPVDARPAIGTPGFAISADGGSVRYYDNGERQAPVVVLLASLGRSVSDFNELVMGLNAAGYRTLAVESRGIGAKAVAYNDTYNLYDLGNDIEAALAQAGIAADTPLILTGHAFGNRVVRAFAARTKRPIARIILLAAGGAQDLDASPAARDALFGSFKWWLPPKMREKSVRYAFFSSTSTIPEEWKNGWYLMAAREQVAAVKATDETEWRAGDGHSKILVVQALDDTIAPPQHTSLLLAEQMPGRVTVINLHNAGHALLPEQPAEIRRAIIGFLSRD